MEAGQGQKTTLRSSHSSFWPFMLENSVTHINYYYCRCGNVGGLWCVGPTSFSSARSATPASAASSIWPGPTRNTPTPPQTPPRPRPPPITRKSSRRWVSVTYIFTSFFCIIASARLRDSAIFLNARYRGLLIIAMRKLIAIVCRPWPSARSASPPRTAASSCRRPTRSSTQNWDA